MRAAQSGTAISRGPAANPCDMFCSGLLATTPDDSGPDGFVYDPADTSLARLESEVDPESRADQRMVLASAGKHCVYHTAPLKKACEISGFFRFEAWISIDQPDTDLKAAIYEVTLAGDAILLSCETLRARYRHGFDHASLLETEDPERYRFTQFTFISREIAAGSRLRLVLGPSRSIYRQRNYNSGGIVALETVADSKVVAVRIYHDQARPADLSIPLGHEAVLEFE